MMARANLPEDVETLKDLVLDLYHRNQRLELQLEQMAQRRQFLRNGNGDDNQLGLFGGPPQPACDETPAEAQPIEVKQHRRHKGHGRKQRAHLPRRRVEHELPAEELNCPCCSKPRERIGEETSEQLEYKPAELYIIEHVRVKYACRSCAGEVVIADKPHQPIEKGLPGPGLLAFVATSKFCDHQPLHRLERILGRLGGDISRSTMCDWLAAAAALLETLQRMMVARVLASRIIHTDDTSVPVLDPPMTRTKSGRLWVYIGDVGHPYTVYQYTPTHEGVWPLEFLGSFAGFLQADAYRGYDQLYANGRILEVACWAHARRKFEEAESSDAARSLTAVAMIGKLYDIEREARDWTAEQRLRARENQSRPQLARIKSWLEAQTVIVLPKSPIGQAIAYVLGNWLAFERYTTDGDLSIDNNASERALRDVVIGRRNWLFAGSDNGGSTAAVLCSIIASCKRHGVEVFAYLRDVFARLPSCPTSQVDQFLPDRWQAPTSAPPPTP